MLEKIKTLLDSGCWVEVEYEDMNGRNPTTETVVYSYDYQIITKKYIYSMLNDGTILLNNTTNKFIYKITSVKPIVRPLYQYKVGDKVVVLENCEEDIFFPKLYPGDTGNILGHWNGSILVEKDGDTYSIDIRCIAPVLD